MTNRAALSLTLLLALLAAAPARSGPSPGLCGLAFALDRIAAAETGAVPLAQCPVIGFGSLPDSGAQRSQAGAYAPDTGQIELAPDLDLTSAFGQSFLLHELVHAAQYRRGTPTRVACPAELEAEAYRIQAGFLRQHGLQHDAAMMQVFAGLLGQCPGKTDY